PIAFTFFFSGPRDHRGLHSFPTRRSSDLLAEALARPGPDVATVTRHRVTETDAGGRPVLQRRGGLAPSGHAFPPSSETPRPEGPDRKSTRLNSSHVSISYAVFCLKKKKKT